MKKNLKEVNKRIKAYKRFCAVLQFSVLGLAGVAQFLFKLFIINVLYNPNVFSIGFTQEGLDHLLSISMCALYPGALALVLVIKSKRDARIKRYLQKCGMAS